MPSLNIPCLDDLTVLTSLISMIKTADLISPSTQSHQEEQGIIFSFSNLICLASEVESSHKGSHILVKNKYFDKQEILRQEETGWCNSSSGSFGPLHQPRSALAQKLINLVTFVTCVIIALLSSATSLIFILCIIASTLQRLLQKKTKFFPLTKKIRSLGFMYSYRYIILVKFSC